MKRVLLVLAVFGALAAWPAGAGAATFKGVVVGKLHGSVLVAAPGGAVQSLQGSAAVGSRIVFSGGRLAVVGRAHTARIRGIVVRRIGAVMFISSNKNLVAVHTGRRLADTTPTPTTPTTPAPGTIVSTQVGIGANGELDEQSEDDVGTDNASSLQVQAVVASVGNGTVTLTVNGQPLTIPLPAGLTLPASIVNQTVTLNVDLKGNDSESNDDSNDSSDDSGDDGGGD